jgi:hypothetical protein
MIVLKRKNPVIVKPALAGTGIVDHQRDMPPPKIQFVSGPHNGYFEGQVFPPAPLPAGLGGKPAGRSRSQEDTHKRNGGNGLQQKLPEQIRLTACFLLCTIAGDMAREHIRRPYTGLRRVLPIGSFGCIGEVYPVWKRRHGKRKRRFAIGVTRKSIVRIFPFILLLKLFRTFSAWTNSVKNLYVGLEN